MSKLHSQSNKAEFSHSACLRRIKKQERTVPFSLRLTKAEHAQLKRLSAGMSMAAYARQKLLGGNEAKRQTRGKFPVADHAMLGKLLAKLGQSDLAANMAELTQAARSGSMPLTPESDAFLRAAHREILTMKKMLMAALGIREE